MKVGVIGAGAISDIYLKNMTGRFGKPADESVRNDEERLDRLEVVCVANRHIEKAQKKAQQYGIGACSIQELMDNPEIEMVVNLTPLEAHASIIRQALEAGKHVYTEKTLAATPGEAQELMKLAASKGLYLGSAPDTFLGSALQTARKAVDEGMLGEIHSFAISANRCNDLLISLFPFLRTPGTGILLDYGVYYISALVHLLGPVERVGAMTAAPYPERAAIIPGREEFGTKISSPNESEVSAILRLRNGIIGTFHVDAESCLMDEAFFAIYGTKGILYLSDPNQFGGQIRFLPNNIMGREAAEAIILEPCSPYSDNARGIGPAEMADAIAGGRPCRASAQMACHVLEVLRAMLISGQEGGFVDIDSTCGRPQPLEASRF